MSETSRFPDTTLQAGTRWATYATAAGDSGWFGLASQILFTTSKSWMSWRFQWCNRYVTVTPGASVDGILMECLSRGCCLPGFQVGGGNCDENHRRSKVGFFRFLYNWNLFDIQVFQSLVKSYFHQMFPVLKGSWMIECQFFLAFFVSQKFQPQPFLGKRWPWRIVSEEYASFGRDLGQIWRRVPWIRRIWRRLEKHGVSVEN